MTIEETFTRLRKTGTTGLVTFTTAGDPNLAHVPAGGTLWTFKLFEE